MEHHTFEIDRREWLRGEGTERSALCRSSDGKKCCVGIYLESLGVPIDRMLDVSNANFVAVRLPESAQWLIRGLTATPVARTLYRTNDEKEVPDREAEIVRQFAANGVTVTFSH